MACLPRSAWLHHFVRCQASSPADEVPSAYGWVHALMQIMAMRANEENRKLGRIRYMAFPLSHMLLKVSGATR